MSKWKVVEMAVGIIGGICGAVGLYAGCKSKDEDDERHYQELEKRYGLTPVENEAE